VSKNGNLKNGQSETFEPPVPLMIGWNMVVLSHPVRGRMLPDLFSSSAFGNKNPIINVYALKP